MPHQPTLMEKRQRDKLRQARAAEAAASPRPAEPTSSGSGQKNTTNGQPAQRHRRRSSKSSRLPAREKSRRRFVTMNSFVDYVGRYLHANDREVWHVLFRFADAETNTAEIRLEDIAVRLDRHPRTVSRSVDRLIRARLVERLKRGTRQGGPSRYLVDPDPTRHADAIKAGWELARDSSGTTRRSPPPPAARNADGRFTT